MEPEGTFGTWQCRVRGCSLHATSRLTRLAALQRSQDCREALHLAVPNDSLPEDPREGDAPPESRRLGRSADPGSPSDRPTIVRCHEKPEMDRCCPPRVDHRTWRPAAVRPSEAGQGRVLPVSWASVPAPHRPSPASGEDPDTLDPAPPRLSRPVAEPGELTEWLRLGAGRDRGCSRRADRVRERPSLEPALQGHQERARHARVRSLRTAREGRRRIFPRLHSTLRSERGTLEEWGASHRFEADDPRSNLAARGSSRGLLSGLATVNELPQRAPVQEREGPRVGSEPRTGRHPGRSRTRLERAGCLERRSGETLRPSSHPPNAPAAPHSQYVAGSKLCQLVSRGEVDPKLWKGLSRRPASDIWARSTI